LTLVSYNAFFRESFLGIDKVKKIVLQEILTVVITASLAMIGAWSLLPLVGMITGKSLHVPMVEYSTFMIIPVITCFVAFLKLSSLFVSSDH